MLSLGYSTLFAPTSPDSELVNKSRRVNERCATTSFQSSRRSSAWESLGSNPGEQQEHEEEGVAEGARKALPLSTDHALAREPLHQQAAAVINEALPSTAHFPIRRGEEHRLSVKKKRKREGSD